MASRRKGRSRKSEKRLRVAFRRNRVKPARDKDWTRRVRDEQDAASDAPLSESVIAKGALSRKRTVTERDGEDAATNWVCGTVVAMRGLIAEVDDGQRIWPCTVRRILRTRHIAERNPVAVGDRVRFAIEAGAEGILNQGVIEAIEPRHGVLTRIAGRKRHIVAANVNQAVIVASCGIPPLKPHLIDRYVVAAHAGNVEPVICINKIDLDEDGAARATLSVYQRLKYRTLATSARTGEGLDELKAALKDQCSAVAGQSGVGKSSLLNAIDPRFNLRVGEVSEETSKGRHITTTATLIKLEFGGYVVDTPGVRSFDLSAVPVEEIEMHFVDFADYIPDCRFPDCTHTHESDCAVKAAVQEGRIAQVRYESYSRMFQERFSGAP